MNYNAKILSTDNVLLKNVGKIDPLSVDAYVKAGGAVTMADGTALTVGDELFVDAGGDLALALASAEGGKVALLTAGKVSDANGAALNVEAAELVIS
ncbi:MAG: hypothetical protein EHM12_07265, partial [Dehalococcoidia bacterium]